MADLGIEQYQHFCARDDAEFPIGVQHFGRDEDGYQARDRYGLGPERVFMNQTPFSPGEEVPEDKESLCGLRMENSRLWGREYQAAQEEVVLEKTIPGGSWSEEVRTAVTKADGKMEDRPTQDHRAEAEWTPLNINIRFPRSAYSRRCASHLGEKVAQLLLGIAGPEMDSGSQLRQAKGEIRLALCWLQVERQKKLELMCHLQAPLEDQASRKELLKVQGWLVVESAKVADLKKEATKANEVILGLKKQVAKHKEAEKDLRQQVDGQSVALMATREDSRKKEEASTAALARMEATCRQKEEAMQAKEKDLVARCRQVFN